MAEFEVVRQAVISAEPSRIHGLIDDLREWTKWSPWEDLDPQLQRTYTGAESGVGAKYAWTGNRKAGAGRMEIVASAEREIAIRLDFEKPWQATNQVLFELNPTESGATEVVWRMSGQQQGLMKVLSKILPTDKFVGKDFEKGLARLKAVAEGNGQ
ncbi:MULTISPECIES: SRPBCC family protein [Nocardia]|uniref:Transcriptional regulator n=1 Tax=Nocardia vulneris TaxID=1141657 RepID=A0ABR4ZBS8_9NOCA|nr:MULTISPECIES: SRPBCC family protein [Nocardia]KIA62726.1 transcriptional regulator [Nocardia vulneris]MBF6131248.1 SRPBCC family protein [Nocardia brasiliensis]MBF6545998.1 SRPBCC family protein [Nocardia brasiliensis]